jgi:hypothetical protein
MRRRLRILVGLLAALMVLVPATAAQAAAPTGGTVVEGAGMAGVSLGWTRARVEASWGSPAGCSGTAARRSCSYRDGTGATAATVLYLNGALGVVTTQSFDWTTTQGVRTGSAASVLAAAYGTRLVTTDYYHRVLPGSLGGVGTKTTFTMDWWAPYSPEQYFGVLAITVAYA